LSFLGRVFTLPVYFIESWHLQKQWGKTMHEVKVYDSSGKLKKVISARKLNIRSKKQLEFPALFMRNKRNAKMPGKAPKTYSKATKS